MPNFWRLFSASRKTPGNSQRKRHWSARRVCHDSNIGFILQLKAMKSACSLSGTRVGIPRYFADAFSDIHFSQPMHRFYLPPEECKTGPLTLAGREAHHALRVLRVRRGDRLTV